MLDQNLRWKTHLNYITDFAAKWSNTLRSIAGIWWGTHPVSMLNIYKSIIRFKLDFGCFFFGSAATSHFNKLNSI